MREANKGRSKKKSGMITALFFVFSLAVVAVLAIVEFGGEHDRNLENVEFNPVYLVYAAGCFLLALLCESLKYIFLLKHRGYGGRRVLGFSCAVIGKYYDNLTPAGSGGQGFQMYYLKKHGCDNGTAGGIPIIGFLGIQFAFVFIAIAAMILGRDHLGDLVVIRVTAIAGLVFYAFIPICIIVFAIAPKPLEAIVRWGTGFLGRVRIIKDPDSSLEKAISSLQSYTDALRAFWRKRGQIAVVFILSLVYQAAFMSLPFFVLKFFGAEMGFMACFCRVVYIYCAIAIIITPGNSGAAEASFYMVFNTLSGGAIFWGMLVWRALCYYSWIVLGAIIQLAERVVGKRRENELSSSSVKGADEKGG